MEKDIVASAHAVQNDVRKDIVIQEVTMTAYCLWLILTDNRCIWLGFLFGIGPYSLKKTLKACRIFNLCLVHKMMVCHVFAVFCCIVYEYEIGFGKALPYARGIMFGIGVVLIFQLCVIQCKRYQEWKRRSS